MPVELVDFRSGGADTCLMVIDRLVNHTEVLTLTGDSYRTSARRELFAKDSRTGE